MVGREVILFGITAAPQLLDCKPAVSHYQKALVELGYSGPLLGLAELSA